MEKCARQRNEGFILYEQILSIVPRRLKAPMCVPEGLVKGARILESDSPVAEDCLQQKFLSILELAVLTDTVPAKTPEGGARRI